jgi:broad specificity phosphatase PhoE
MKWPTQVVLVRHGQSEFNVLRNKKESDPLYWEFRKAYKNQFDSDYTRRLARMVWDKYRLNISD